jgi:glycosyltransferase involved in cell wall biosynthesis
MILSQNNEDIRTALREGICKPDRIRHLGNGIDLKLFDPARVSFEASRRLRYEINVPQGARIVGFVGRLAARRKGFADFLKAAAEVLRGRPDTWFVIVGDADEGKSDAVRPTGAGELELGRQCRFLGQRPNAELPGLYGLMDVLVLPSLFEGIPRAIMEASAMGVPVVATDVKGNRETVMNGQTGILVPLGDVAALAGAISAVLSDATLAKRLGEAGQRLARARFDERLVFERITTAYAELLANKYRAIGPQRRRKPLGHESEDRRNIVAPDLGTNPTGVRLLESAKR